MPNVNISISVLAKIIKKLNRKEKDELSILLSKDGEELLKRKKELENGKAKFLSEEEVFDV